MKHAYLGLGSNLGDRVNYLKRSLELLSSRPEVKIAALSSLYETEPVGGPAQGPFLNACAVILVELTPVRLLQEMLSIEERLGRVRKKKWGPRVIDLDLLAYEGITMNTPILKLPHPLLAERDFVLIPLGEIAPSLPVLSCGKTVGNLLASRKPAEGVKLFHSASWTGFQEKMPAD